jgi:ammonium transporter, Amt family
MVRIQRRLGPEREGAPVAFVNTNTAMAAALLSWIAVEKIRTGKPTTLGAMSGAITGAVAITPAWRSSIPWGLPSSASSPG